MRIVRSCFYIYLSVISSAIRSQTVAEEISKDVNAIILYDETNLEVKSISTFEIERSYEIKILRRFDKSNSVINIYYDEFSEVKNAKVEVYNASKKRLNKFDIYDFDDISTGGGLASDSRAKQLNITNRIYPFYIKVYYKVENIGSLHTPIWRPQNREGLHVNQANFVVKKLTDANVNFNFKSENINKFDSLTTEEYVQYRWEVKDVSSYKKEPFSYGHEYSPVVFTSFDRFKIDGILGKMDTWNSFGRFIVDLNNNKNNLTDEQKNEIREISNSEATDLEKIKKTYAYLQNSTRYVSIQLGIGGWAPFDASFVHEKKYGDCKALSYYTKAALEELGIDSYYTLIRARSGAKPIAEDFPNAYFNHAILTVPIEKDTLWLECTSQTNPFGYLGTFTSNRKALLIREDGGHLINTKKYKPSDNTQDTNVQIQLNSDGSATTYLKRKLRGLEIENGGFLSMLNEPKSEQEKWFSDWDWGDISLEKYAIDELKSEEVPESGYEMNLNIGNAAVSNSNRLFMNSSIFTRIDYISLPKDERIAPIEIRYPYIQTDSISVEVPEEFELESGLKEIDLSNAFGSYHHSMRYEDNEYHITRRFQLNDGIYPPNSYEEFKEFITQVQKSDKKTIVFRKAG